MIKQAVILAGGNGTRLKSVVSNVPKSMAEVDGKPFISYLVQILMENGFSKIIILTGYKSKFIENFFRNDKNVLCIKESQPLGTAGAVLNAYSYLDEEFCVINGDTFFDIDYSILANFSKDKQCVIGLSYSQDISRYGLVKIDNNYKISEFTEKNRVTNNIFDGYINSGIYYLKKTVLKEYFSNFKNQFLSFENDVFPTLNKKNLLYGLPLGGYFIDIGIPEDYIKAQKSIPLRLSMNLKPALFVDKDGTLIKDTGYQNGKDIEIIQKIISTIKEYYENGYRIIMVTNQAGIAKGIFNLKQMKDSITAICQYYKEKGIIFSDVEYCPYHIESKIKEYKYDSLLRKPNAGMILNACKKFRIDLKKSVMIGDNEDIDNIRLPYIKCIINKTGK